MPRSLIKWLRNGILYGEIHMRARVCVCVDTFRWAMCSCVQFHISPWTGCIWHKSDSLAWCMWHLIWAYNGYSRPTIARITLTKWDGVQFSLFLCSVCRADQRATAWQTIRHASCYKISHQLLAYCSNTICIGHNNCSVCLSDIGRSQFTVCCSLIKCLAHTEHRVHRWKVSAGTAQLTDMSCALWTCKWRAAIDACTCVQKGQNYIYQLILLPVSQLLGGRIWCARRLRRPKRMLEHCGNRFQPI